ncbi:MAG: exodeoxyribonuclease VII small subunit [Candidatus Sericytochromatia bacterium]|nr:exodeoxyribonuclease VII small subunit [Candidatus Sericytochromatia bacterium]
MSKKKPVFEESLSELEKLVGRLESEEIPLAEAIAAFEKGQNLIKACEGQLQEAEQVVKQLLQGTAEDPKEAQEIDFEGHFF